MTTSDLVARLTARANLTYSYPIEDILLLRGAANEIDRLNAENVRLREALEDVRNNGLIYWEPRTERGHVSKAQMLSRIDAALAGKEEK